MNICLSLIGSVTYLLRSLLGICMQLHKTVPSFTLLYSLMFSPQVADFGLARLVERSNEEEAVATRLVGTPGYIAPE